MWTYGTRSEFYLNGESYPSVKRVRTDGGGGGQGYGLAPVPQMNGGSGGGAICSPSPYSGGTKTLLTPIIHKFKDMLVVIVHQIMVVPMLVEVVVEQVD